MALTVDVTLRSRGGVTVIDVEVSQIHTTWYRTVWDLRTFLDQPEPDDAEQPQAWLCVALRHLLDRLDCDLVVDQADEGAAAATPAETTLDLGELELGES